jgi:hypothetical protein
MVLINNGEEWVEIQSDPKLVFVIKPGSGTYYNKEAYKKLEEKYEVVYFGQSGGEYDKYPLGWENNNSILNIGFHLGGIAQLVKEFIFSNNKVPSIFIVGSRGGQVTIGKIWESIWQGPTIIINAGCLATNTRIPLKVTPIFVTMKWDYFEMVNTYYKIKTLFDNLKTKNNQLGYSLHLENQSHMPKLNGNLLNLLLDCSDFLKGKTDKNFKYYNIKII